MRGVTRSGSISHARRQHSSVGLAPLRGVSLDDYNAGQMTYDLRRLRLRGLIERIPHSQRYRLTSEGLCIARSSRPPETTSIAR